MPVWNVATGVRKDDARSDIYFIGCIYYHMLSGNARDAGDEGPHSAAVEIEVHRRRADPSGLPGHSARGGRGGEQGHEPRTGEALSNAGQMYADLRQAAERLEAGDTEAFRGPRNTGSIDLQSLSPAEQVRKPARGGPLLARQPAPRLLVVESNSQFQDLFRDALKRYGYRVLVISDAKRAVARVEDTKKPSTAWCSAGNLGDGWSMPWSNWPPANRPAKFRSSSYWTTSNSPNGGQITPHLCRSSRDVSLPVKLREVRDVLFRLVPPVATAET